MQRFLAVPVNEDEFANYNIAFLAVPLTQEYVGGLASCLAASQQAFEVGAFQVKFMAFDVYVVGALEEDTGRPEALEYFNLLLGTPGMEEGVVLHIGRRNVDLLKTYKYQVMLMGSDGDMIFKVSTKYGPWASSNTVQLSRLRELV